MTRRRALLVIFLWLAGHPSFCQDTSYAREVISRLCDPDMQGRGYVLQGDRKAADYIRNQFEINGIRPLGKEYFQSFPISINTFPGTMNVSLNGQNLIPGRDFIVDPASPGLSGNFVPVTLNATEVLKGIPDSLRNSLRNKVVIVDARELSTEKDVKRAFNEWKYSQRVDNKYKLKALIEITGEKLIFGASTQLSAIPYIIIKGTVFHDPVTSLKIQIKSKYLKAYRTQNVSGYIPGTDCPDSFLVFTAHYDHLGTMGKGIYFPGANDNASGTAMMLELSRYFSRHPQRYSIAFLGFTGEEAGLLGSGYFVDNPLISLSNIKFLVNLDLVGTGADGITVVNATEFHAQFEILSHLNDSARYIVTIKKRGKACNSDHCPFYSKGVPGFFIYTLGGVSAYHDLDDRPGTLPLTAFKGLSKLLIAFGERQ